MYLPKWCLIREFFCLLWYEIGKHLFLGCLFIFRVEHSLALDVSEVLIIVNRKEEITSLILELWWADDYVALGGLKLASARIFSLPLDWRHKLERIRVEIIDHLFAGRTLEDGDCCIMELFLEWVGRVNSRLNRKSSARLGHWDHDFGIISWSDKELWVFGVFLSCLHGILSWKPGRVRFCPLGLKSDTGPIFREVKV